MLVDECERQWPGLRSEVLSVAKDDTGFTLELNGHDCRLRKAGHCDRWTVMPGLGASPFGYDRRTIRLNVLPTVRVCAIFA